MHGHQGTPTPEHVRQALHRAGYSPIPVQGKKPAPEEWQKKTETNAQEIALWSRVFPHAGNTGILTKKTPTADIDILNPEGAEAVEALARERWEERGHILVRIGKAPKRAILLRTDAPFKKITGNVIAPDGSNGQKIELLCDGQQVVVFGTHPGTGRPYAWHGGEPGAVPWEDLPYVTEAQAKAFVDDAVALLVREHGYTVPKPTPKPKGTKPKGDGLAPSQSEWTALNTAALQNLSAWVPALLPAAVQHNDGWRVPSKALGRDLQEDLSITPQGIKDFGIHDQGDAREGKRSPIDLVIEHGEKQFGEAVSWLRERLGLGRGVSLDDFYAYMPRHLYVFAPTGDMWPTSSINGRFGPGQHLWLDRNKAVEQMTWAPGRPQLIRDRLVADGGWIERHGAACFNLYRPPTVKLGDKHLAGPWLDHVRKVYPDEADHIVMYLAHRVQRPEEKINHAVVLGGAPGVGKDTLLEPVKHAVGPWNFSEVSPQQLLGRFNEFLKCVLLRVSELRDMGDINRFQLYEYLKPYQAAPPDVLRVDEKNLPEHPVLNVLGMAITTNHLMDGMYLPADDRRHFVAWTDLTREDFEDEQTEGDNAERRKAYWNKLWGWYGKGGIGHVAAYLATLDISTFDPKAPPRQTPAFWAIVDANRAPEDAELADVLDTLKSPTNALTIGDIARGAIGRDLAEWLKDRKNRRVIPHRLGACGYVAVRNDVAKDGLWKVAGERQVIYARRELSISDRIKEARIRQGRHDPLE